MKRLVMMVGIPASGKSLVAEKMANRNGGIIVSTDAIREELYGRRSELGGSEIFVEAKNRIIQAFKNGEQTVYYDATNLSRKKRTSFIRSIRSQLKENISATALLVATSVSLIKIRNEKRPEEHRVPAHVIEQMLRNFQMPMYQEGFGHIILFYNDMFNTMPDYNVYSQHLFESTFDLMDFNQESNYHSLTLGEHLYATYIHIRKMMRGDVFRNEQNDRFQAVSEAGLLHDIGKEYTKTFRNTKGELDFTAHYYGHDGYGAYLSLFYPTKVKNCIPAVIYRAQLISNHMIPYSFKTSSQVEIEKQLLRKFKDSKFVEDLMLLHISDYNSH